MKTRTSKTLAWLPALILATLLPICTSQATIELQLSADDAIYFEGGHFSFGEYDGQQWTVSGTSSSSLGALDLRGSFGSTSWMFTPDSATHGLVAGTGVLTIAAPDAPFTGNFRWIEISTDPTGGLNATMKVNVDSISYEGTVSDLVAIRNAGAATLYLSFQNNGHDVNYLHGNDYDASYSATLTAVPEASTLLAGLGALGMLAWGSLRRRNA